DAADHVAGQSLRRPRLGHACALGTQRGGDRLEVELPVDRHDPDRAPAGPALEVDEQRLEDPPRLDPQRLGGPHPVRRGRGGALALRWRCRSPGTTPTAHPPGPPSRPTSGVLTTRPGATPSASAASIRYDAAAGSCS